MARTGRVSIYLNFQGQTEEAFRWYADVFGGELGPIARMGDVPSDGGPALSDAEKEYVMHVELPILDGTVLMGTDMLEAMGKIRVGNNVTINLEPATLEETQRLYDALSVGATDANPLALMFWDAYWGTCLDRYGIRWMFNYPVDPQ